ncbi:MAG: ATP-binding cassette domain-containing protein [Chloroflexi bacterium]|nr:ATP-binding cassette domain-containing protein [Chloroflexota bacterium]
MSLYTLESVVQEYGGRRVLEIERFTVEPREILGIVGPSGAGKSTLLRLMAFVEPATGGEISFGGEAARGPETPLELRRRVTMVFQRPVLLHRSVAENVAFGLRVRGEADARRKVDAALAQVGLTELAGKGAAKLSGGEAQRAALARALVLDPDVLLLDEPTANLDPYNVGLIEAIVREQNAARGTTVVLVTHNVFQAKRLATRAGLLLGGRLVELAPNDEFFESPKDQRTAAFVRGEMVY